MTRPITITINIDGGRLPSVVVNPASDTPSVDLRNVGSDLSRPSKSTRKTHAASDPPRPTPDPGTEIHPWLDHISGRFKSRGHELAALIAWHLDDPRDVMVQALKDHGFIAPSTYHGDVKTHLDLQAVLKVRADAARGLGASSGR
jgi:hypothetical protein